MERNYKEMYQRIQEGESDIQIALEMGLSVSALYAHFVREHIIVVKQRHSEATWDIQYQAYKGGKSVANIAKDLGVKVATVYNHFYSRGLQLHAKASLNKEQFFVDYNNGYSPTELANKYHKTVTYVRFLLRSRR